MKIILFKKLILHCKLTKVMLSNEKQPYRIIVKKWRINLFTILNSNIEVIYIICMVIPTKVDTSQVPQQNANWMPTVKAMINTTRFRRLICTTTVGQ